ncbi:MAG: biotin/lipoyl-binding protein, partial [Acidimicrobiales bacterium]
VQSTVTATGNVAAPGALAVNFATGGRLVEVSVAAGDKVTEGQVLARIDAAPAQGSLDNANANLASARGRVAQLQSGLTGEELAQANVTVQQAVAQVNSAYVTLANAQNTASQNAVGTQNAVNQAGAILAADQNQLTADQNQLAADENQLAAYQSAQAAAQATVDADQAQVTALQTQQFNDGCTSGGAASGGTTATTTPSVCPNHAFNLQQLQSKLSSDQAKLNEAKSNTTSANSAVTSGKSKVASGQTKVAQDQNALTNAQNSQASGQLKDAQAIQSAQLAVSNIELSLQAADAAYAVKVQPPKQGDLAAAQASVVTAETAVDTAQRSLDDTTLLAPADGTVAAVGAQVGQTVSGGGASATSSGATSSGSTSTAGGASATTASSAFVSLTDLTALQVKAGFSETDAAKVKVGRPATITLSALPNQGYGQDKPKRFIGTGVTSRIDQGGRADTG